MLIKVMTEDGPQWINVLHIQRMYPWKDDPTWTIVSFSDATGDCWDLSIDEEMDKLAGVINRL